MRKGRAAFRKERCGNISLIQPLDSRCGTFGKHLRDMLFLTKKLQGCTTQNLRVGMQQRIACTRFQTCRYPDIHVSTYHHISKSTAQIVNHINKHETFQHGCQHGPVFGSSVPAFRTTSDTFGHLWSPLTHLCHTFDTLLMHL